MTKDKLTKMAETGDIDAMLQLVNLLAKETERNDAIDWADKVAERGNVNGIYKAANLHSIRMKSTLDIGMPFWGLLKEDSQAIILNAGMLMRACQEGRIDLNEDTYSSLLKLFKDALYCEAVACYYGEPNDNAHAVQILKDINSTREQTLCGLCYFELYQHDDAKRLLSIVYQDQTYVAAKKVISEQGIYATAMFSYSRMVKIDGDYDKAVMILKRGIEGVTDEEVKEPLRKELGRYQKKMLGGWKYT